MLPLDHPTPERAHRLYFALTNACNRDCPWCSTCSSTRGGTFLSPAAFQAAFPDRGPFQVQLEGGEPTVHPELWRFVDLARAEPRCERLVLCTNGVVLPRRPEKLRAWLARLGAPLTLKLSVNHFLLDADPRLLELARMTRDALAELAGDRLLVVNVRLRKGYDDDDARVRAAVEQAGLGPHANVFFLQRYGFASGEEGWDPPRPVWDRFSLVNPDGRVLGPDLVRRSEAMRVLP
jgi:pyruvate-formate lyase-activating enzyme